MTAAGECTVVCGSQRKIDPAGFIQTECVAAGILAQAANSQEILPGIGERNEAGIRICIRKCRKSIGTGQCEDN